MNLEAIPDQLNERIRHWAAANPTAFRLGVTTLTCVVLLTALSLMLNHEYLDVSVGSSWTVSYGQF